MKKSRPDKPCTCGSELDYYVNRHLEDGEKWKLIFELTKNANSFSCIEEYFTTLIDNASSVLSVTEFTIVVYDNNLLNKIFSMKSNEESDFLNSTIFKNYRLYDALDELKLILKLDFLLLPIRQQENESGYLFLRFKNQKQATEDMPFLNVLSEHIGLVVEQMSLNSSLQVDSKEKMQFLVEFSHELKTPLNAIIGYSEVLKENIGCYDSKTVDAILSICSGAKQLKSLMLDIMEGAKLRQGKLSIRREHFCTKAAILAVIDVFRSKITEKNLQIEPILMDLSICSDLTKFNQILYNLFSNAVKFSPLGGKITIITWSDEENFNFEISDQGHGIEQSEIDKIFSFLYQANSNIAQNKDGSGIGLAVCKRIIELQGGEINLSSLANEDTTISFKLPLLD